MLSAGALEPWKTVITSFWLDDDDAFNLFSFFCMHFSSADDRIARILGGPDDSPPLLFSYPSRTPELLELDDFLFSACAPIPT